MRENIRGPIFQGLGQGSARWAERHKPRTSHRDYRRNNRVRTVAESGPDILWFDKTSANTCGCRNVWSLAHLTREDKDGHFCECVTETHAFSQIRVWVTSQCWFLTCVRRRLRILQMVVSAAVVCSALLWSVSMYGHVWQSPSKCSRFWRLDYVTSLERLCAVHACGSEEVVFFGGRLLLVIVDSNQLSPMFNRNRFPGSVCQSVARHVNLLCAWRYWTQCWSLLSILLLSCRARTSPLKTVKLLSKQYSINLHSVHSTLTNLAFIEYVSKSQAKTSIMPDDSSHTLSQ